MLFGQTVVYITMLLTLHSDLVDMYWLCINQPFKTGWYDRNSGNGMTVILSSECQVRP